MVASPVDLDAGGVNPGRAASIEYFVPSTFDEQTVFVPPRTDSRVFFALAISLASVVSILASVAATSISAPQSNV